MSLVDFTEHEKELVEGVFNGNRSILEMYEALGPTRTPLIIALYSAEKRSRLNARNCD